MNLLQDCNLKLSTLQMLSNNFLLLEFSLVFDKSDQHLNIYDSYNAETATKSIKYIKLQNASNTYSEFNTIILRTKRIDLFFTTRLSPG